MVECPPLTELRRHAAGQLAGAEREQLQAHLDACPRCRNALNSDGKSQGDSSLRRYNLGAREDWLKVPGYEILEKLGQGAWTVVYRARQVRFQRFVVLKTIRPGSEVDPELASRFLEGVQAVAHLRHPGIAHVFEIGEAGGYPFAAMEYMDGIALAERLPAGAWPLREAAELVECLAHALTYAHEHGVPHGNLKPANILLPRTRSGSSHRHHHGHPDPRILDFGMAKLQGYAGAPRRPDAGSRPSCYLAPEQMAASEERRTATPAADIYALGAILYHLITGQPLFEERQSADRPQRNHPDPIAPSRLRDHLPRDLETITLKCLARNPLRRYLSAADLAEDLRRFLAYEPIIAEPPPVLNRSYEVLLRRLPVLGGAAAAIVAVGLGVVGTLYFSPPHSMESLTQDRTRAERLAAIRHAYRTYIGAAATALAEQNVNEASRQLKGIADTVRGWEWAHLHSRLDQSLDLVDGLNAVPSDAEFAAAHCPAGSRMLQVSPRHLVTLVDPLKGIRLHFMPAGNRVFAAELDDGHLLAIDEYGGSLKLVHEDGTVRRTIGAVNKTSTTALAASRDGKKLVVCWRLQHDQAPLPTGTSQSTIHDLTSEQPPILLDSTDDITSLAFAPDGKRIASGSAQGELQFWDAETGHRLQGLPRQSESVRSVTFSPDSRQMLSVGSDGMIHIWDTDTGGLMRTWRGHPGSCITAVYSPDGSHIATAGLDGLVRLWDSKTYQLVRAWHGHTGAIARLVFTRDGKGLASHGWDGTARFWDATVSNDPWALQGNAPEVCPVLHDPQGRWFASVGADSTVRLWDSQSLEPIAVLRGHSRWIAALGCSVDGIWLISRGSEGNLMIWDTRTGARVRDIQRIHEPLTDSKLVYHVAVSPDGALVVMGDGNKIRRWELSTGAEHPAWTLPVDGVRLTVFKSDGSLLAAVGSDHVIYLLDASTGEVVRTLSGHMDAVNALAFDGPGSRLVSGGRERHLRIWDVTTGQTIGLMTGHKDTVLTALFHPDGQRILSGGRDSVLRVWDAAAAEEVVSLPGHRLTLHALSLGPGGRTLISGSGDTTIRVWGTEPLGRHLQARRNIQAAGAAAEQFVRDIRKTVNDSGAILALARNQAASDESFQRAVWHVILRENSQP